VDLDVVSGGEWNRSGMGVLDRGPGAPSERSGLEEVAIWLFLNSFGISCFPFL